MSSEYNRTVRDFVNTIKQASESKTKPYDIQAEVLRTDGDIAWVHIPGGVSETPVQMMVNAKRGDTVQVRIAGGHAWLYGNQTAPPTDDTEAKEAKHAVMKNNQTIAEISTMVEEADEHATYALVSANGKNTVYHSEVEPTGGDYREGDTWFNASEGYAIYTWDGSSWVKEEFGSDAIANMAITNAKIADATIDAAKISSVDVGSLTGGYINAVHIDTESLTIGAGTLGDKIDEMDQKDADLESDLEDLGDDIDGLGDDISDLNEDLDTLENRVEATYGTCSTSSSTSKKVVVCDDFVAFDGARLTVKFTNYSNVDSPTLEIVDSGNNILVADTPIYNIEVAARQYNPVKWGANTTIRFIYRDSRWNVDEPPGSYFLTCSSTASSNYKYAYLYTGSGLLVINGTTVTVRFTYGNTYAGLVFLNINQTGDASIIIDNNGTSSTNKLEFNNSEELTFVRVDNAWRLEGHYASKTAKKYITYMDSDRGIHVHDGTNTSNYAQLNSNGMMVYRNDNPVAYFGDFVSIGGNNDFSTELTADSMAIRSENDPLFSVQRNGEMENRNVYMLKTSLTSTIFSSAKSASYTETRTWQIHLKPNTYRVALSGYTTSPGYIEFTVGTGTYPTTPVSSMSGSHGNSVNTLKIKNGQPVYVAGTSTISEVIYTVELIGKRDSGTSTAATKRINWAAARIYYTKDVYKADIIWNSDTYSDVGKNIYINGGTNYTDSDGPNLTTDYSISGTNIGTSKSIGWIDLYDGVYVVVVRARYEPTSNGACHTWIQFSTKENDAACSQTCYNVKASGYLWNQHHATFLAYPLAPY